MSDAHSRTRYSTKGLPKLRLTPQQVEERTSKNQDLWKKIFDLYAIEGKLEGSDMLGHMLHGAGSRFLGREIDETYISLGKPTKIGWNDLKGLAGKEAALQIAWDAQARNGKGSNNIALDTFEQIFVSFQYLLDSSPDTSKLDVSYLSYLLSSCGEELSTDTYDEFIKTIGHTTKGPFSLPVFLAKYAQFAMKIGVFSEDDMAKAQVWIDKAEEKYGIKKKTRAKPVEEKKEEPEEPAAPPRAQRASLFQPPIPEDLLEKPKP